MQSKNEKKRKQRLPGVRGAALCLCLLGSLALAGCGQVTAPGGMTRHRAGLDYTEGDLAVSVRGTYTRQEPDGYTGDPGKTGESLTGQPRDIAAEVQLGRTAAGARRICLRYTQPEALAGLTLTTEGAPATVTVTLDGLTVRATDGRYDRLLLPALLLLGEGDITAVGRDGEGRRTVTLTAPDEPRETVLHFLEGEPIPALVEGRGEGWELALRVSPGPP